ncbi:protein kinase (macronuclear) [Tetrahymena thermophila SB210]|uniref:Protein kinase n=1 Tax=Tetrahymena thermophila (strain SB210) TaxID=312017 RepID=A4VEY0_TETTS|nr:protein kinase [Tetrahymena thermophila SB210]EDK32087.2 protein kinase [Tetrahymena thermophila SB210]|eukprot:XP_001471077.2 protein kinase [Tetrahymena thermophila SB210]
MQNRIFEGEMSKYQENKNLQIQGGQASIYFAIDLKNQQQVIIKEYFKDSNFQVDYAVLKKIQDKYSENLGQLENLVKIYDLIGEKEKIKFIVIEYCNEGDLYNYLFKKQQEVQTLEQAIKVIDIVIQITKGMMILKELNLAHRDLKPEY